MRLIGSLVPRRLARDRRGATLPEFAIVLPTFLLLLFGIYDVGQAIYAQSVLQGALQDAGRDAGIEGGVDKVDEIDEYVRNQTSPVAFRNPKYEVERLNYKTFSDVGRAEDYEDKNKDGQYNDTECFWDENDNGGWDDDVGKNGVGGANDVAVYRVTLEYDRVFPLWKLLGQTNKATVAASTTLRNQPYGPQPVRNKKKICPAVKA